MTNGNQKETLIQMPPLNKAEQERLFLANKLNARKNGTRPGQIGRMLQPNRPKSKLVV